MYRKLIIVFLIILLSNFYIHNIGTIYADVSEASLQVVVWETNPPATFIAGNVVYYDSNSPINNVTLNLSNGASHSEITNTDGFYQFNDLVMANDYLVKATREDGSDVNDYIITTYDAALVAMASVGIIQLSEYEGVAADVNRDNQVTTFDAALIAQYVVGLSNSIEESFIGEWNFLPDSMEYINILEYKFDQNYIGIILGNVHGGWSQSRFFKDTNIITYSDNDLIPVIHESKHEINIPILVKKDLNMISLNIDLNYENKDIIFDAIEKTNLIEDFSMYYNNNFDRLRIAVYGVKPVNKDGTILNLKFQKICDDINNSKLTLNKYQINNNFNIESVELNTTNDKNDLAGNYKLEQNYPNPFVLGGNIGAKNNFKTSINYSIGNRENVIIKVYNFLGQEVITLINKSLDSGLHQVYWDGSTKSGEKLASGIYLYSLQAGKYMQIKKLILLR